MLVSPMDRCCECNEGSRWIGMMMWKCSLFYEMKISTRFGRHVGLVWHEVPDSLCPKLCRNESSTTCVISSCVCMYVNGTF